MKVLQLITATLLTILAVVICIAQTILTGSAIVFAVLLALVALMGGLTYLSYDEIKQDNDYSD